MARADDIYAVESLALMAHVLEQPTFPLPGSAASTRPVLVEFQKGPFSLLQLFINY